MSQIQQAPVSWESLVLHSEGMELLADIKQDMTLLYCFKIFLAT